MKIDNREKINNDLTEKFVDLQSEYNNVYIFQADDQIFMYRSLGRNEFKLLVENEAISDMEKEEIVCESCVLWPENYDFGNCDAGIPTRLSSEILRNSFLDSIESRKAILFHYRQEMYDLDNQITCIINEAFPQHDIEEIEAWDVAKTAKYLSRAEWKLVNLRGAEMKFDPLENTDQSDETINENDKGRVETEEIGEEKKTNLKGNEKKKLTPEELQILRSKYPEMEWGANSLEETTLDSFKDSVDVGSPALRPGW